MPAPNTGVDAVHIGIHVTFHNPALLVPWPGQTFHSSHTFQLLSAPSFHPPHSGSHARREKPLVKDHTLGRSLPGWFYVVPYYLRFHRSPSHPSRGNPALGTRCSLRSGAASCGCRRAPPVIQHRKPSVSGFSRYHKPLLSYSPSASPSRHWSTCRSSVPASVYGLPYPSLLCSAPCSRNLSLS